MVALLLAGTIVLCAGLLTVVFGIPIKEFSFGNTMILAGAVIACTGIVLIGLSFVVRELKNLARHLEEAGIGLPRPAQPQPSLSASAPANADAPQRGRAEPAQPKAIRSPPRHPAKQDVLFARDQESDDDFADEADRLPPQAPSLSPSPQWTDEPEVRARPAPPLRSPERSDRVHESGERRRDILFSSSRREAERDQARDQGNGSGPDFLSPADTHSDRGAPEPFEPGWPPIERARSEPDFAAEPRNGRAARNGTARQPPRRNEAASVTVVKSGVVDAMAYSLYSDGSIEAQMPEGMVRFESIEELRAHLDQRG